MSLADIVRAGVKIADGITATGELQQTVVLYRWKAQTATGSPVFAPALSLGAIVSHAARRVRMRDGTETVSSTQVTFLTPIPALSPAVTGRTEPIDERDEIVLPTGVSGPILRTDGGLADPDTSRSYTVTVYMG